MYKEDRIYNYLRIFNRTHFSILIVAWMFFAETTNYRFTSEHIKQSCLTNCAYLVRHQRIHWGQNADSTNTWSFTAAEATRRPGLPPIPLLSLRTFSLHFSCPLT